uniref:C2 domain-containing protein n=1 Tax=Romanomermis culicivorax TaxID=13658 RepID=A0A915HHF9_ROMCU
MLSYSPDTLRTIGTLNPELYRFPEDGDLSEYPENHIGRLWFTLEYDKDSERLTVTIGKIRNLPSREVGTLAPRDSFVRAFLLPDERRYFQTKIRRKTCNPKFDDVFHFSLSPDTFDERALKLVVYDLDSLRRTTPIGTTTFFLKEYTTSKQRRLTIWRDIRKDGNQDTYCIGEIHCSLCYNDAIQRLTVTIDEVKNIKSFNDCCSCGAYAKIIFSVGAKHMKCKKSKTMKINSDSMQFKESFTFALSTDQLDQAGVSVQLMTIKNGRPIGRVVFGGNMLARGKPLQHWLAMLKSRKEVVQDWHYLTE